MERRKSTIIKARNLSRIYGSGPGEVVGVRGIDLDILEGEMTILKGNSGSGKSTLLALLAGLDVATGGEFSVGGLNLGQATEDELTRYRREVVGMVFQSFNLLPTLDALENVCLPALLAGRPYGTVRQRGIELLEWLQLGHRLHHLPAHLSGGEMQRTAIARALINEPKVILADEPTGNLDSRNGAIVMELLTELNRAMGRTVIIATHSTLADPFATRTIVLKDGAVTETSCNA